MVSYFGNYRETWFENAITQAKQIAEKPLISSLGFLLNVHLVGKNQFGKILNTEREQFAKEHFRTNYFLVVGGVWLSLFSGLMSLLAYISS